MTKEDTKIVDEIYEICYNGKMFNRNLLPKNVRYYIQIVRRAEIKLKECHENAGGMEFGLELEKILGRKYNEF